MIAWLAPGALLALAAAALPLAIHLLTRRQRRQRPFPALRFVQAAAGGRARLARLRDHAALIARTLALAALALALAGPSCSGDPAHGQALVVVVDASASMRQLRDGGSLWQRAVAEARSRLDGHPGSVQLVVAGDEPRRSRAAPGPGRGPELALLADAAPGFGAGCAATEVAGAARRLSEAGGGSVVLLSDGSRSGWSGIDPGVLPPGVRFAAVDCGGGGPNLALRALSLEPGLAVVGGPLRIGAEVANYGPAEAHATIELVIDGRRRTAELIVPAGGSAILSEEIRAVGPPRRIALSAAILASDAPDALPDDDRRAGCAEIVAALPVLVASDADPAAAAGPLKPVLAALAACGMHPRLVRGAELSGALSGGGPPPALCSVALAAPPSGMLLQGHLLDGGAWLQLIASEADQALAGALPDLQAPLRPAPLSDLAHRPRGLGVRVLRPEHPLLSALAGRETLVGQIEAWRYRPCAAAEGATPLLGFLDGSVALAERAAGRGRWLMSTLPTADADSNFAALDCLPLLLAPLPRLLLPPRRADAAQPCGSTVAATSALRGPDGATAALVGGACRLDRPGLYLAGDQPAAAGAIPALESDLRTLPAPQAAGTAGGGGRSTGDAPLWSWLLLAALLCGAAELLLVRPWRGRA